MRVKLMIVVFVSLNSFCVGVNSVVLIVKEMVDNAVSKASICVGVMESFFDSKSGKNELNVF